MIRLLTETQRRDWLRLSRSENVGPATFRQLVNRFGGAGAALEALPDLSRRGGLSRPLKICSEEIADRDLENAKRCGAQFVVPGETGYPPLLRHIDGAPPLLCIKGDATLADMDAVAIVGARNASAIGRKFARQLAAEIGNAGYLIVSGLARGIDTAAHEAAPQCRTLAALAGGIDYIYPPENEGLQRLIGGKGLLVSEMVPGTVPKADHFPRRNRIISGISRAVIIVEAAMRSGSLITARLAGEQGRDVFAVPGSPLDPRCEGANKLIKDGASLLTSAADVLTSLSETYVPVREQFLEPQSEGPGVPDMTDDERKLVLSLLSPSPIDIDDLIRESGLPAAAVTAIILELELAGRAMRHAGRSVSRT